MKKNKWFYACLGAMAFGMFAFLSVSCSDDDKDEKPEEGEVVVTPEPETEYYILGTVTEAGKGLSGIEVKVNAETVRTDADGKFTVTGKAAGTYAIEAAPAGYLPQKTNVEIAAGAENRSVVTVALALTKKSEPVKVEPDKEVVVEDNSATNEEIVPPGETEPDKVVEDAPVTKAEVVIPAGALPKSGTGINEDGSANVSVTNFVPAPKEVSTKVDASEENKEVEKSTPLAAVQFEPSGLTFEKPITMAVANPIPGVTFAAGDMLLTYLNPDNGQWEATDNGVVYNAETDKYEAPIYHFSSYAMEGAVKNTVSGVRVIKDEVLGEDSRDNTKNAKALTDIVLKYTEKSGWDYEGNLVETVKAALPGASTVTVNAMVAYVKTRMFAVMGSLSGVTSTERVYNTVNVNGYTQMNYVCYAKVRTTVLKIDVMYNRQPVTISVSAKRYTGADHQYTTVTYNPGHSGGQGTTN